MILPFKSIRAIRLRLTVTLLVSCALALCNVVPVLQAQTPQKSEVAIKLAAETKKVKERIDYSDRKPQGLTIWQGQCLSAVLTK